MLGQRVLKGLQTLQNQAQHALDLRAQMRLHPYILIAGAVGGSVLLGLALRNNKT